MVKKIFKYSAAIILFITIYLGFITLIGYEWDRSPTTIYQNSIGEGGQK